ncbi:hypothetical protein HQ571_02025 [Candidatus Kuenenbacteria bacterium]|nr:hypothetical protein [Candidatus Kuenenbacteria bacterium]
MHLLGGAEKSGKVVDIHRFLADNFAEVGFGVLSVDMVFVQLERCEVQDYVVSPDGKEPIPSCAFDAGCNDTLADGTKRPWCFIINNKDGAMAKLAERYSEFGILYFWYVIFHEVRHAIQRFIFCDKTRQMFKAKDLNHDPQMVAWYAFYQKLSWRERVFESDAIFVANLARLVVQRTWDGENFDFEMVKRILLMTPDDRPAILLETIDQPLVPIPNLEELKIDFSTDEQETALTY